jgi:hypothetical protein
MHLVEDIDAAANVPRQPHGYSTTRDRDRITQIDEARPSNLNSQPTIVDELSLSGSPGLLQRFGAGESAVAAAQRNKPPLSAEMFLASDETIFVTRRQNLETCDG